MAKAKNIPQPARTGAPAAEQTQEQAAAGEAQAPNTVRPFDKLTAQPEPVEGQSAKEPLIVALLVTSKTEGFRRAGRAWSREQTRVELADLTDDQVEAIWAEPMLDVIGVGE